jgi:hypothetical protein
VGAALQAPGGTSHAKFILITSKNGAMARLTHKVALDVLGDQLDAVLPRLCVQQRPDNSGVTLPYYEVLFTGRWAVGRFLHQ